MVASLNRPIVTDYHPIRNRPVLPLVVLALMAAAVVARDLTAAIVILAAAGLGGLVLWLADAAWSDPADDGDRPS
ncbi:MAG: hypothetical protein K2X87_22225 [Gemmataceae bacterium]|nr:hypothetical protein [Gemmataceae bacterium]